MSDAVLEIRGLSVDFPGLGETVRAVRDCSISVRKGEILGLVGESGSGKSVTAMACLGLVPPPGEIRGSVEVAGQQVVGRTHGELEDLRGGTAAMIFQDPGAALNPFFTVGRQIADVIVSHQDIGLRAAREAAIEALRLVHLPDPELAVDRYPHQLSGGQLQRAMIAMAMACEPDLLIADEPTTALDVTIQAQIIVLLRELAQETGLTILFITHDLGVVASLCDRVAVMYAGEIVETGPLPELFDAPAHPYTERLMRTVPRLGGGKAELAYIEGQVPNMARLPRGCAFHTRCAQATEVCRQQPPAARDLGAARLAACHHALGAPHLKEVTDRGVGR